MALGCPDCRHWLTDAALPCPTCGRARPRPRTPVLAWLAVALAGFAVGWWAG